MAERRHALDRSHELELLGSNIFRDAVENASDAIGIATPEGHHVYQNRAFTNLFGVIGEDPRETVYCSRQVGRDVFRAIMNGGTWNGEVEMYDRDHQVLSIMLRAYPILDEDGKVRGLVGIHTDITQHRQAEVALRESDIRFRKLFDDSADALHLMKDDRFVDSNDAAARMYGFANRDEIRGKTPLDISPERQPDGQPSHLKARKHIDEVLRGTPQRFKWLHSRYDTGELLDVEVTLSRVDFGGETYILASGRDVTRRTREEEAIRQSEATYRELFNAINDTVWVHDVDTFAFIDVNARVTQMFGYTVQEALQLTVEDISSGVWPYTRERATELLRRAAAGNPQIFEWHTRHKDGHLFWTEVSLRRGTIADKDCLLAIERDITERKEAESTMERIRALESLGTIAGGIAHDFNNLLMGVFSNIDLAEAGLPPEHPSRDFLQTAHKALDSAHHLTTRLLTFSTGGSPVLETVDLRDRITETVRFHLAGSNVAARFDLPEDLWPATADKGQLSEVIANMTLNAKDAMPEGGTLCVQARNVPDASGIPTGRFEGDQVQVVFRDEGVGIAESSLRRIFDPYFSTKQEGSGLGLAVVHSIISKHGGRVDVESEPGKGTTMTILLPAGTGEPAARETRDTRPDAETTLGNRTALVVDDVEVVRKVTSSMLERLGYRATTARNGREALEAYASAWKAGRPFDVTITDLTIPGGMGGREVVQDILALNPTAKVIVTSGYSSDPVMANYATHGFSQRLAKPYTLGELAAALEDVFGQTEGS